VVKVYRASSQVLVIRTDVEVERVPHPMDFVVSRVTFLSRRVTLATGVTCRGASHTSLEGVVTRANARADERTRPPLQQMRVAVDPNLRAPPFAPIAPRSKLGIEISVETARA
jgi:hypothetical protein